MADHDYLDGGWKKGKYIITHADGSAVDPRAIYFVLRLDEDPCAREAMRAYADAVEKAGNREFAEEIRRILTWLRAPEAFEADLAPYCYGCVEGFD